MLPLYYSGIYKTPDDYSPPVDHLLAGDTNYPNLNSNDYSARPESYTLSMYDCWDSISISKNGNIALATNKRNGREWWGSFFGFDQILKLTENQSLYSHFSPEIITKLQYANNGLLLVGHVTGRFQVWNTQPIMQCKNEPIRLRLNGDKTEHNQSINQLKVFKTNNNEAITTCQGLALNVWNFDSADLVVKRKIHRAHNADITGLDTAVGKMHTMATCGRDGVVKVWDLREVLPARRLYKDPTVIFNALNWTNDNIFLGDFDGQVSEIDLRVPGKFVQSQLVFKNAAVTEICSHESHLAIIGNQPASVKITNVANLDANIYENIATDEGEQIRDAVWFTNESLLTVGIQQKFQVHNFSFS